MNCETCGNPIDRQDAERGSCAHCGAVLAHVLRAAEKAELVRRVVAQGNAVRIEGDSIEAAPPGPTHDGPDGGIYEARPIRFGVAATLGLTLVAGIFAYFRVAERARPATTGTSSTATSVIAEPLPPVAVPTAVPIEPRSSTQASSKSPPGPLSKSATPVPTPAAPRTVDDVVAANKARYDRCQRDELGRTPSAPRRYTLAVTLDQQGHAEWIELLSEGSAQMSACLKAITRSLDFPKSAAPSKRAIITLSFGGAL